MEQPPEDIHEKNDHVLDIPDDVESRNSQEPVAVVQPTTPPGGSSRGSFISSFSFWIYVRLIFNISQIVASVAVLVVSRNEKPQTPLRAWIVGYAVGCAASIPILFQHRFLPYPTLSRLLEHFKWMLKVYFFIWFVTGNVWLFGGNSSGAPNLRRLYVMFLVFSYLEFTMPFILCAVLACCCGDLGPIRGASSECVNSLPAYTIKLQKDGSGIIRKINSEAKGRVVEAAGAEKESAISGADAVCCICLASYVDNDVLKELPCSHFFHTSCVDKWLKMKALCPLCKCSILPKK